MYRFANFFIIPLAVLTGLGAFAQTATRLTYDKTYDNGDLPLDQVACSDGPYGLKNKGYTTLGSLPTFPDVGGVYTISGHGSPQCGSCYAVTYNGITVNILGVDVSRTGFTVSEEAMNALTNNEAEQFGSIDVTFVQVPGSVCGIQN